MKKRLDAWKGAASFLYNGLRGFMLVWAELGLSVSEATIFGAWFKGTAKANHQFGVPERTTDTQIVQLLLCLLELWRAAFGLGQAAVDRVARSGYTSAVQINSHWPS